MSGPLLILVDTQSRLLGTSYQGSGEITDPVEAIRFLYQKIVQLIRKGERRRLMLANLAIDAYRRLKQDMAA